LFTGLVGASGRAQVIEEISVVLEVPAPFLGQVVLVEDSQGWADRFAGSTVDTLVRLDVERTNALIDAVHRALIDASPVFDINAWLGDHISHGGPSYDLTALA